MVLQSDAYKGMTAKDKKTLEMLDARKKQHDGFYRVGEDEFSQTFSAEKRRIQADSGTAEASSHEQSEYYESIHGWYEIKAMFQKADSNGNGFIDKQELESVLSSIGMDKRASKHILRSVDLDANGCIDLGEFVQWMQSGGSSSDATKQALQSEEKQTQTQTSPEARPKVKVKVNAYSTSEDDVREALRNIFKQWDTDGSGHIGRSAFHSAMAKTGLKTKVVDKMFDFADADKSGSIEIDEFINWAFKEVMPVAEFQELQLNRTANVARLRPATR